MSCREKTPFEKVKENITKFIENMEFLGSVSKLPELVEEISKLEGQEKELCMEIVNHTIVSLSELLEDRGYKWN